MYLKRTRQIDICALDGFNIFISRLYMKNIIYKKYPTDTFSTLAHLHVYIIKTYMMMMMIRGTLPLILESSPYICRALNEKFIS
jgi:hypothetical protein